MIHTDNLQDYLSQAFTEGISEFVLKSNKNRADRVTTFYLHPLDKNGHTIDFEFDGDEGNKLRCLNPTPDSVIQ